MPTVLLLRHAQSGWNAERRWQGQADPDLSPLGEAQAADVGRRLRTAGAAGKPRAAGAADSGPLIDLVVSSDLVRAHRTAEIVASAVGAAGPHIVEPLLRELDVGSWSGLTRPEIEQRWPGQLALFDGGAAMSPPGGETRAEFEARVAEAVARVAALVAEHRARHTLVVSHGGVLRALARLSGHEELPVGHLSGYRARPAGRALELIDRVNLLHELTFAGPAAALAGTPEGVPTVPVADGDNGRRGDDDGQVPAEPAPVS